MFTGIVQALGTITSATPTAAGKRLAVALGDLASATISPGDSVCISGVCLTALPVASRGTAQFDVITETLNRTTLGSRKTGDRVNLELSLRPDSYVGGHFVQGHIDAVATVAAIQQNPLDWRLTFRLAAEFMPYVVPKGSVAVDGVSMTIAAVTADTFTLAVIPTTLEKTTLSTLHAGDPVNVETDILARTVVHYLKSLGSGDAASPEPRITFDKLRALGFA